MAPQKPDYTMNPHTNNQKILIVDDKLSNIAILEDLLQESGYKNFKSINDSRQVISLMQSFKPDLLILDLMMPYLSGFEVMGQLKDLIPQDEYLPILILTADINIETKIKALSAGANDFLSKPFNLYEVQLRIKNLLKTRSLHILLENQNQNLELKVLERTKDLELANRDMIIARDAAMKSDRLKTAFLNNISHEIRTPLNGILGFGSLILEPELSEEEKEQAQDLILSSTDRLMNTVTNIMDASMIISGTVNLNPKSGSLLVLLQNLHLKFTESITKINLAFKTEFPAITHDFSMVTDWELVFKLLSHLMDNAIKFTSTGSITLGCEIKKEQLRIYVTDTGIGISQKAQEHLLEAFMQEDYSSTRQYEGSGLGLNIANGLAKLLGGHICIESVEKAGTSVSFILPIIIER